MSGMDRVWPKTGGKLLSERKLGSVDLYSSVCGSNLQFHLDIVDMPIAYLLSHRQLSAQNTT